LIPVKVGTQAAGSDAALEKLDNVPQATFPLESVTAGATKTFTLEYTQNPVGEAIKLPPVWVGAVADRISVL
jgi:hypothetical protein